MDLVKVLLVDDEQDIVDTVKYSLELRGYDVETAFDGVSALQMARTGRYQVIVLDVMLPGKNGYEVSRVIKDDVDAGRIPPTGIVLITARKLDSDLREEFVATWSRADACIYKPFEMEDLTDTINDLLQETTTQS
jgi:CheY-like chemotaxis protein